jgi:IPT/TIG domain
MHSRGTTGLGSPPDDSTRPEELTGRPRPPDRALTAMAKAARRARADSGGLPPPIVTGRGSRNQVTEPRVVRLPANRGGPSFEPGPGSEPTPVFAGPTAVRGRPRRRWVVRSVEGGIALGLVIAAVIVSLAVGHGSSPRSSAAVRVNNHPATTVTPPAGPAPSSTGRSTPTTTPPSAPATTAAPTTAAPTTASPATAPPTTAAPATAPPATAAPAALPPASSPGAPQISSVSPAGGYPGQVVTVTGTNLVSPNGVIVASFDGQQTPTACPTRTACEVTVPNLGATPKGVVVVLTTVDGTSNGLAFSYG